MLSGDNIQVTMNQIQISKDKPQFSGHQTFPLRIHKSCQDKNFHIRKFSSTIMHLAAFNRFQLAISQVPSSSPYAFWTIVLSSSNWHSFFLWYSSSATPHSFAIFVHKKSIYAANASHADSTLTSPPVISKKVSSLFLKT